jgi:hypothetical protein
VHQGDALVAIDEDDCSNWPLSRVRARLGNLRVPIGKEVHLTFERRIVDNEDRESLTESVTSNPSPMKTQPNSSSSVSSSISSGLRRSSGIPPIAPSVETSHQSQKRKSVIEAHHSMHAASTAALPGPEVLRLRELVATLEKQVSSLQLQNQSLEEEMLRHCSEKDSANNLVKELQEKLASLVSNNLCSFSFY